MICPQCGYDMGNKNKCIRCGYAVKTLAVVDEHASDENVREEHNETKVIDPCNVYLTHPYGYEDDYDTGFGPFGSPFSSLFDDLFGDPISDLLGGLFGFDIGGSSRRSSVYEDESPKKKRKQGPVVEVRDVEIIDDKASPQHENKTNAEHDEVKDNKDNKSFKNPFKKNNKRK